MGIIQSMVNKKDKKRPYGYNRSIDFKQRLNPDKTREKSGIQLFLYGTGHPSVLESFQKKLFPKMQSEDRMMFNMKQVGKKILVLRKKLNMTQTELADKMDVSFQAFSNWERGNSMPDISKLPQLAELFGCTVDELLDGKSELLNSAMADGLQEYAENNEISREELDAAAPILKPDQLEQLANSVLLKNGDNIEIFFPYLDDETMREVAERRMEKGESIADMLDYLDDDLIGKFALQQYGQGKSVEQFYDYMEDWQLKELAERKTEKGESIADMLEYLDADDVGELALRQYEAGNPAEIFYEHMDDWKLKELAERKIEKGEAIEGMLEYLDADDVGELALKQYDTGKPVEMFYDYLDEDQMGELAKRKVRNKESIKDLLDHLDSDVLRELVRELLS